MYKPIDKLQHSFLDFNQPMGLHMNPDNRWIKLADRIPWDQFEVKYAKLFPSDTGNVAKPLRMALGALIIQTKFQYSDRELVEQIAENPYLQYFIGLPGYQEEAPFDASTLVLFRKRISAEMLSKRQTIRLNRCSTLCHTIKNLKTLLSFCSFYRRLNQMDKCTHEVRKQYWKNIINQCLQRPEGMTAKQWLDENNICEQTYYH